MQTGLVRDPEQAAREVCTELESWGLFIELNSKSLGLDERLDITMRAAPYLGVLQSSSTFVEQGHMLLLNDSRGPLEVYYAQTYSVVPDCFEQTPSIHVALITPQGFVTKENC